MIFGKPKDIKQALDNMPEDEPVALIIASNPLSFDIVRNFYNRCKSSDRLNASELTFIAEGINPFEHYTPKSPSLIHPLGMASLSSEAPKPEVTPETEEKKEVINESEVIKKFDNERKADADESTKDNVDDNKSHEEGEADAVDKEIEKVEDNKPKPKFTV